MWLIRSAICALYPGAPGVPGVAELGLDEFLARYRREAPTLMWLGLVLGAIAFTLSPILTIGWPLPSFWLPREALDRHASRAAGHRWYLLRQLVMIVKMSGGLCWGQHPQVRQLHGVAPYPADPGSWRTE